MSVTKSIAEKYLVRAGHEWTFIYLDDAAKTISITGSLGEYGYSWNSIGTTFKRFLIGLDNGYLTGKLCPGEIYNPRKAIESVKKIITKRRKEDPEFTKEQARAAMDALKDITEDVNSSDIFQDRIINDDDLSWIYTQEYHYDIDCMETPPQFVTFLKRIWPEFIGFLKGELEVPGGGPAAQGGSAVGGP